MRDLAFTCLKPTSLTSRLAGLHDPLPTCSLLAVRMHGFKATTEVEVAMFTVHSVLQPDMKEIDDRLSNAGEMFGL